MIAVWGGLPLHSFRYFAGSPILTTIETRVEIEFSENPYTINFNSKRYNAKNLPLSSGYSSTFADSFSDDEDVHFYRLSIPSGISLVSLKFNVSVTEPGEIMVFVSLSLNNVKQHTVNITDVKSPLNLDLLLPLPGLWTMRFQCMEGIKNGSFIRFSISSDFKFHAENAHTLQALHYGKGASLYFSDLARPLNKSNLFRLDLTSSTLQIGKSMKLVLKIFHEIDVELDRFHNPMLLLKPYNLSVFGRIGNFPAFVTSNLFSPVENDFNLLAHNSTEKLKVISEFPLSQKLLRVKYLITIEWLLIHPHLFRLDSDNALFLLVVNNPPNFIVGNSTKNPEMTISVFYGHCPSGTCVHGDCYVDEGYLETSGCFCR